jgi:hypothetical protein
MDTGYHTRCESVKQGIPAVRHEPHPGYPGSVATYVTGEGRLLPLWTEDEVAYSYEVIALIRQERAVAA